MASVSSSQDDPHFQPTSCAQLLPRPAGAPATNWRCLRDPLTSSDSLHQRYGTTAEGYFPQAIPLTGFDSSAPQHPESTTSNPLKRFHLGDGDHNLQKIITVCAASSQQVRKWRSQIPNSLSCGIELTSFVYPTGEVSCGSPSGGRIVRRQGAATTSRFRDRTKYVNSSILPWTLTDVAIDCIYFVTPLD